MSMTHQLHKQFRRRYFVVSTGTEGYDLRHMIKALLLIFDPTPTWERIAVAQRKCVLILAGHLLPLLLLAGLAEGYGLVRWGKPRGNIAHTQTMPLSQAIVFETAQLILSLLLVFLGARLI